MPEICRFFGIVITVLYSDHAPPHFHARYGEHKAEFRMDSFALMKGRLPPRIHGFVVEWAGLHQEELFQEWALARASKPLFPILPLE